MIEKRKAEHIDICNKNDVETGNPGFDRIRFVHRIPQINKDDISTKTRFLGKDLNYPFLISAMTGGHRAAKKINERLAEAAEKTKIALAVGSQRAALEDESLSETYSITREKAPTIPVISNIGAVQLGEYSPSDLKKIVAMVKADALAVHFNPLQEAVQPEGETNFKGVLKKLKRVCSKIGKPVIAKETGAGFCREDAILLKKAGVKMIDVAGFGGTSFSLVEHYRGSNLGKTFSNWGIPTAKSMAECRGVLPLIASGGIRSGLDAAKAIALGGILAGFALPFLRPAMSSSSAVVKKINLFGNELKTSMFLTNSKNLSQLKKARLYSDA